MPAASENLLPSWLDLGLSATLEWNTVASGGVRQRASGRALTTLGAEINLGDLLDREGAGTLVITAQTIRGESGGSLDSGDAQVYSNLESDENRDDIMDAWYERLFSASGARLKMGKLDANSEFAYVDAAGDFTHSSAGFSPSIFVFPSYPDPATSINLFFESWAPWSGSTATLGYGLYDGSFAADGIRTGRRGPSTFFSSNLSDDFLHLLQWEILTDHGSGQKSRTTLGAWKHTGEFERFDGSLEDGTEGFFATWERSFPRDGMEDENVHVFGQYGWADDAVSPISEHVAAGLVVEAPLAHRTDDRAGVYASLADFSEAVMPNIPSSELAFDAYYRVQCSDRLWIQPEVQWIIDPSGEEEVSDALVLGLRLGAEF